MTPAKILQKLGKFINRNSPSILTAIGVTGTLTTAYLTGKASFKAAQILADEQRETESEEELPLKEKVELVWKLYIPAAATGTVTVASIIFANQIGTRRAAAVAAAYSLTEKAFAEYKDKVAEKLGPTKTQKLKDEIAQDQVNRNPVVSREVIVAKGGDVLCYDSYTGRYFQSDMETLRKAENEINFQIIHDQYASLSDFYDKIGLPRTHVSDSIGWSADRMLELEFSTVLSEDNRPCISIRYDTSLVVGGYRFH